MGSIRFGQFAAADLLLLLLLSTSLELCGGGASANGSHARGQQGKRREHRPHSKANGPEEQHYE